MNKERAASLIFLSAGIYGLVFSLQLPLGYLREPGPGMLPLCLSILLCLSGVLWFIYGKRKEGKTDWYGMVKKLITPLKIVGVTGGFILVMGSLGYLLASSLYIFLLFFWISRYRLWMSIGLSVAMGVGSWYFFGKMLSVQLPKGLLSL